MKDRAGSGVLCKAARALVEHTLFCVLSLEQLLFAAGRNERLGGLAGKVIRLLFLRLVRVKASSCTAATFLFHIVSVALIVISGAVVLSILIRSMRLCSSCFSTSSSS